MTILLPFPYLGWEAPTRPIRPNSCMVGDAQDVIMCAKCEIDIFVRYDFTGVEFSIFLLIFALALQQCSANALPVMLMRFSLQPHSWLVRLES